MSSLIADTRSPRGLQPPPSDVMLRGLSSARDRMSRDGVPVPDLEGKLLRPLMGLLMVPKRRWERLDERFWCGALAIQMAHEASLLHDDVIDGAPWRRGRKTMVAERGVGAALLQGDRFLTGSYRAAAATDSFEFMTRFAAAVERTVAGEVAQGTSIGLRLTPERYDSIISSKSGELFGIATALGGIVLGLGDVEARRELGCAVGSFYQRLDDLIDYCSAEETGKPPLQDYRHRKWSWVLDVAGITDFSADLDAVLDAIFRPSHGEMPPARQCLAHLHRQRVDIVGRVRMYGGSAADVQRLLGDCTSTADRAVTLQERSHEGVSRWRPAKPRSGVRRAPVRALAGSPGSEGGVLREARAVGGPERWPAYFRHHAKTFSLAARLFPEAEARRVTALYAYCRFTDDLVDGQGAHVPPEQVASNLEAWRRLSHRAYRGERTHVPLLDVVFDQARHAGVEWGYAQAVLDGVRMDLEAATFDDWPDLERYTFGVAGAVGGWMTQLFGLRDPELLERAHDLGHAMQLTNIARDVGEDWAMGRRYLPSRLLDAHGITRAQLARVLEGQEPLTDSYCEAIEDLLKRAEALYERAWPGVRALPSWYRRPVAAAASAYRGIHGELRRNGYDNVSRRAYVPTWRKIRLGAAGVLAAGRHA